MESVDNPWGCGTSTGGGKKLCLCLFCIKAAESGWAAGKNLGHPRRTGGRKMQERRRPCRQGGGAAHGSSRRPRPTGIPAHGTGRPSVPPLQKCRDLFDERRRGRSQTGPRAFARGARIQDVTLICLAALGTFPLRGGRLAGGQRPLLQRGRNLLGRAGEGTRPCEMGESSGFAVGADDLGGPRAHSVRPYREKEAHLKCSLGEGIPSPLRGTPL